MTFTTRITPEQRTRRLAVLATALFAPVVGYGQMLLGWGQTPAEFAAGGDETLRVAGYAFSIWGLIYGWLIVHGVWQVLPKTFETELLARTGWPAAAAMFGTGVWIVASAAEWRWATIVVIALSALTALFALLMNAGLIRRLSSRDPERWLIAWPLGLLAGWLTIATAVNVLTVLTSADALPAFAPPTAWAVFAVALVVAIAILVTWRLRLLAYALPIAWGLLAVFVAEVERNTILAFTALAAALIVLGGALVIVFRLRSDRL